MYLGRAPTISSGGDGVVFVTLGEATLGTDCLDDVRAVEIVDVGLRRVGVFARSTDVVVVKVDRVGDHGAEDSVPAVVIGSHTSIVLTSEAVALAEIRGAVLLVALIESFSSGLVDELLVLVVKAIFNVRLVLNNCNIKEDDCVSGACCYNGV